ncbi:uncharacterized protein LOC123689840 isoform X2 [Pieris rapae]|nr:uncharacterized protein LOC123689840 isoform X2 [Pieris rapae]
MTSNNYEPRVEFLKKVHKRVFRFPYPDPINPEKNNNGKTIYGNSLRRTYPTIKIHCPFDTTAIVLVSCITDDVNGKHMPHPHRIVRHPDCKNGVCVVNGIIKNGEAVVVFRDIALLRTLKKDALEELQKRREFVKTIGAECNLFRGENIEASKFKMYSVRICFQVLLKMGDRYMELKPLISEPLIDYLALRNLNILEMCPNEGRINWATKIILVIKRINKTDKISVIFVDKDSNEIPAVVEKAQPLPNRSCVLICYTPKIFLEDSARCSEFAVKVRLNNDETLSENMRGFVFRRMLWPNSDYSETEYLKMLKDKKFNSSLIAEIGASMSVPSGQEYTETVAQEVYNTPNTSYAFFTQNTQNHLDKIISVPSGQEYTETVAQEVYNTPSTSYAFFTQNTQNHLDKIISVPSGQEYTETVAQEVYNTPSTSYAFFTQNTENHLDKIISVPSGQEYTETVAQEVYNTPSTSYAFFTQNTENHLDKIISVPSGQEYTETVAQEVYNTPSTSYAFFTQNTQNHLDKIISVPSGQEYTETVAQEVYNTPSTSYALFTQNTQTHPNATLSEDLILNNDYWEKNSNTLQANNVYPTIRQMDTIPFHTLPRVNSLIRQDNEQHYFQDNGTNSAIQQDYNSRLEQQNTQDRPLIQPINDMDIIFELLDEHLKDQHQNI